MQQANLLLIAMAERCLNIIQAKPEDVRLGLPQALRPDHLRWMCKSVIQHAENWPTSKSHRWIGFIQAGMVANYMLNLAGAKVMFAEVKERFGPLANDQDLLDHLDPDSSFEIETGGQG